MLTLKQAIAKNRKRQAELRREEWDRALSEGRVVKHADGRSFTSHPTVEGAQRQVAELADGSKIIGHCSLPFGRCEC